MKKIILSAIALATVSLAGAQTVRHLVVTDKEGKEQSFRADDIQGVLFDTPEYRDLTHLLNTSYVESGFSGLYTIEFGTAAPDSQGNPAEVGDIQVALLLKAPCSTDLTKPVLPEGYFRIGKSVDDWTFDVTQSAIWTRTAEGPDGVAPSMIVDGTVDVRVDEAGVYDIRMEFITMGGPIDLRYQGPVEFAAGFSDFTPFTEPVNIDFSIGQGRFYGNWYNPFAADMMLQFFEGTVVDDALTDGYILSIDMYEPKPEDCMAPSQVVADGTYVVENRDKISYTYLPYTFLKGQRTEFLGVEYINRTRLEYISPQGERKLGLISGGSFTVSDNGTKFTFDFVTEEGVAITGTYNKKPAIRNFCDNDVKEPKGPFSTMTEDITLVWAEDTEAFTYNDTEFRILEDLNTLMFMVCVPDMSHGHYISFTLHNDEPVLTDGTYTVDWTLGNKHAMPGVIDMSGSPMFAWFGDLDTTDSEGYQSILAPIKSGTITVSTVSGNNRKIVFDLEDDKENKITGEFNGEILDITPQPDQARKLMKGKERKMLKSVRGRAR